MLLNNSIKFIALPVFVSSSLLLAFTVTPAKVSAQSNFAECAAKIKKVKGNDDVSVLRTKFIYPAIQKREDKLADLRKKSEALLPDHKAKITEGLDADAQQLADIKNIAKSSTDTRVLQEQYCNAIYKTQIFSFRAKQISYLRYIDARLKRETAVQKYLEHESNKNITGRLSDDINSRYDVARSIITDLVATENALADILLNATKEQGVAGLNFGKGGNPDDAYQAAVKNYTEASAIRKVRGAFSQDRDLTLVSVQLKKDDAVLTTKFRTANKAVVTVKVSGEKNDVTKTLVRGGSGQTWRVTNQ